MPDIVSLLQGLINDIEQYLRLAYDPSLGYFRQGGVVSNNGTIVWSSGTDGFAVDCQTWAMSVLGPRKIDEWFGKGTANNIWTKTKKLGGYHYRQFDNSVDGLGYSLNSDAQAFSGEWSFGAVNMLRIFARETGQQVYRDEAESIRKNIEYTLSDTFSINGRDVKAVKYVNKRYYIPFGWFANPVASLASTAWAIFADSNFNPFYLGGNYTVYTTMDHKRSVHEY